MTQSFYPFVLVFALFFLGGLSTADELRVKCGFYRDEAPLKVRLSKQPESQVRELEALTYLVNARAMRDQILKKSEILVNEQGVATVPVCRQLFPSIRLPELENEWQDASLFLQTPPTFRILIAALSQLDPQLAQQDLRDIYSTTGRPNKTLDVPAWAVLPGNSGILQPDASRVIETWEFEHLGIKKRVLITHDFADVVDPRDLEERFEREFDQEGIRSGFSPVSATAHEMLEIQGNGFFDGYLFNNVGKMIDNAPLTVVRSDADIRHPFFSCLQCHGNGGITNSASTFSDFKDVNEAFLSFGGFNRGRGEPLYDWYLSQRTHFRMPVKFSSTNIDFEQVSQAVDARYRIALKESEAEDGAGALYENFLRVNGDWSLQDIADEIEMSVEDTKQLIDSIPGVPAKAKRLPLGKFFGKSFRAFASFGYTPFYFNLRTAAEALREAQSALKLSGAALVGKMETGVYRGDGSPFEVRLSENEKGYSVWLSKAGIEDTYPLTCLLNLCRGRGEGRPHLSVVIEKKSSTEFNLKREETTYRKVTDDWMTYKTAP